MIRLSSRKPATPSPPVAFPLLVPGLPADVKIRAQLRDREAARGRETDESMLLLQEGYLVPGHSLKV